MLKNLMQKKVTRKKFISLLGTGVILIPLMSKFSSASYLFRQEDGDTINVNNVGNKLLAFKLKKTSSSGTLSSGDYVDYYFTYPCVIKSWTVVANTTGSIQFDLWKDTYANYPPTVADTITASDKPKIVSATKATGSTLTGWTKDINIGDILRVYVDSVSDLREAYLYIEVQQK